MLDKIQPSSGLTRDSLHYAIEILKNRVDSLEKIVVKTEISTGFFTDALSTNLAIFATIIGFAALISWGSIARLITIYKKDVDKKVDLEITALKQLIEDKINPISNDLVIANFDVSRSMFASALKEDKHGGPFIWALKCAVLTMTHPGKTEDNTLKWLTMSEEDLDLVTIGDPFIQGQFDNATKSFDLLNKIESPVIKRKVFTLTRKFYSKLLPPQEDQVNDGTNLR